MNKLLFKFSLFSFLLLGIIITMILVTNSLFKQQNKSFELDKAVNILIMGHSHSEYAYNDSIIKKTYNLSQSGESYYYTYLKLKALLKHNPQLKLIFIEFSNNQIDLKMDNWIWDDIHLNYKFTKLSAFLDIEDTKLLLKHNLKGYFDNIGIATRKNLELTLRPIPQVYHEKDWGRYQPQFYSKIDSIKAIIDSTKVISKLKKPYNYPLSIENIKYLQKAISLIQSYNIDVFLIRTPVHPYYHYLANEKKLDSIYNKNFDTIPFLDFKNFPLNDYQFADDSHVNSKGSKALSEALQNLIDNNLLSSIKSRYSIDTLNFTSVSVN